MTDEARHEEKPTLRVIVADDDLFTVSLVGDGLRAHGFDVTVATSAEAAWTAVQETDPHAIVSDLNFGAGGSGARLLAHITADFPWVGLVVLTSHRSPELAIGDAADLPESVVYLVKSQLQRVDDLAEAVHQAIAGQSRVQPQRVDGIIALTRSQADVLRMLAAGASTRAVAEHRGTTVRAAETMLVRLYSALGLDDDDQSNPRVSAVLMWEQGRVTVR